MWAPEQQHIQCLDEEVDEDVSRCRITRRCLVKCHIKQRCTALRRTDWGHACAGDERGTGGVLRRTDEPQHLQGHCQEQGQHRLLVRLTVRVQARDVKHGRPTLPK